MAEFYDAGVSKISDTYYVTHWITESLLERIGNFVPRKDDVFVNSFPRSGSHWVMEMVRSLLRQPLDQFRHSHFLENMTTELIEGMVSPRILGSNLQDKYLPSSLSDNSRVITLVRNPKDAMASWYENSKENDKIKFNGDFHKLFELTLQGKALYGTWFDFYTPKWLKYKDHPNVLFLQYEEAIQDRRGAILKIAQFLNIELDEDHLQTVVHESSFTDMKTKYRDIDAVRNPTVKHYRKGEIGDWKNYFTVAESEEFDRVFDERMKQHLDWKNLVQRYMS